jgi:hypothetical protein
VGCMTPARHSPWADIIFLPYITGQFRNHFHGLHFLGPDPDIDPALPLLITPNHSTWWDGFFFYILNRKIWKRKAHLMMLEEQLSKYRFFSRIGAFGIEPGLARRSYQALRYSAAVLLETSCAFFLKASYATPVFDRSSSSGVSGTSSSCAGLT